jgi:hypothetical protein
MKSTPSLFARPELSPSKVKSSSTTADDPYRGNEYSRGAMIRSALFHLLESYLHKWFRKSAGFLW